jgi:hypothetical protein
MVIAMINFYYMLLNVNLIDADRHAELLDKIRRRR